MGESGEAEGGIGASSWGLTSPPCPRPVPRRGQGSGTGNGSLFPLCLGCTCCPGSPSRGLCGPHPESQPRGLNREPSPSPGRRRGGSSQRGWQVGESTPSGKGEMWEGGRYRSVEWLSTEPTLIDSEMQEGAWAAFPNSARTSERHTVQQHTELTSAGSGGRRKSFYLGQQF